MARTGYVESVEVAEVGTHLTADAAAAATVLYVESTEQFNEDGGTLAVGDGAHVDYVSCDPDASSITLAAGLAAAAGDGEPVTLILGGQRATTWNAEVSFGVEETVPVPIGFDQREKWPAGPYIPSVPALVADDLSMILDAPGRTPAIDALLTYVPAMAAVKGSSTSWPHNTWQTITGWLTSKLDRITFDAGTGIFTVLEDGIYDFRLGVTFDNNSTNNRAVRMRYYSAAGADLGPSRMVKISSDGYTALETAQYRGLFAGEGVSFEAWQNSTAALDLLGSLLTIETDCAIRWVGAL